MSKFDISTQILQGNVLTSVKIYTAGKNFTRPPVSTYNGRDKLQVCKPISYVVIFGPRMTEANKARTVVVAAILIELALPLGLLPCPLPLPSIEISSEVNFTQNIVISCRRRAIKRQRGLNSEKPWQQLQPSSPSDLLPQMGPSTCVSALHQLIT